MSVSSTFGGAALNKEGCSKEEEGSQMKTHPPGIKILQKHIMFVILWVPGSSFASGGSGREKVFINHL